MARQATRVLALFLAVLLLAPACAAAPTAAPTATASATTQVEKLAVTTTSWDGATLPAYPQGQPEVTVLRITIPAKTKLEMHHHTVINAGILISGQLTSVTKDGKEFHLLPGDSIVEVVNTLHYGVNDGDVPAVIVVFYAGVVGTPVTVTEPK